MPDKDLTFKKNAPSYSPPTLVACAIASIVTILIYIPALGNGFVSLDDWDYIVNNPFIRELGPTFFKSAFIDYHVSNWHPLTMISYGVDYALWGLDPFWYHLENVILHSANAFLAGCLGARLISIYLVKRGATAGPVQLFFTAIVTALLFGLHPVHVESVAWISERKDVLFTFFFLLSLLSYLSYAEAKERRALYYTASICFFALSIISKPMAVTLPVVLIIIDICPLERAIKPLRSIIEKAPFFALSVLSGILTVWAQSAGSAVASIEAIPFGTRLLVALRGYVFYLYKLIVPTGLVPLYPYPDNVSIASIEYSGSIAVIIIITAISIATFRRYRFISGLWAFYLVTLLPVIGIMQVGSQSAADRYMYLPALAPFILIAALSGHMATGALTNTAYKKAYGLGAVTIILATILSIATIRQIAIWKDPVTMWNAVIKTYPKSHLARYNLGGVYKAYGDFNRAILYFTEAIELKPGFSEALNNRGAAYIMVGDNQRAAIDIEEAIKADPRNAEAHYNLAIALENLGMQDSATASYQRAAELGLIQARNRLAEKGVR